MNIEKIKITQLNMPMKSRFETSFGSIKTKDFLLISVDGNGQTGYGESVAMPYPIYNEETTETVRYMLHQHLIPQLKGKQISHPSELTEIFSGIRRNYMAKAAIEGAVWDLYAKQQKLSLADALGGSKSEIDVGVSVGIEPSIDELLKKINGFLQGGYKKIKIKIKPGWDIEPIKAIRNEFGHDVPLMADANSAYRLQDLHLLSELDQYGLMMIEQPLAHDDIIDHAELQKQIHTPICLDESILSVEDARKAITLGSCKIINIKIGRVGGLTPAKQIHDLCEEHDIPVWCGGMLESGVGRAHNIALTSLGNFTIPGDTSPSNRYWAKDIVNPEVTFCRPGVIAVPTEPGIGVHHVDGDRVNQYTVQSEEIRL